MTVAELIEALQKLCSDIPVGFVDSADGITWEWVTVRSIDLLEDKVVLRVEDQK